jgi:hypothetical protein
VTAPNVTSIVAFLVLATSSAVGAQIRTPIATAPLTTTTSTAGPAPSNATATVTGSSTATVSWDPSALIRIVEIQRTRIDNVLCCIRQSGILTTANWNDTGLEGGYEYLYQITATYTDGRIGRAQVIAATPIVWVASTSVPKNAKMGSTDGVLRLTPCGSKSGSQPAPAGLHSLGGTPAGGKLEWEIVSGVNYVVDRTPEGAETWSLVGSTCGGPSPLTPRVEAPTMMNVQDLIGGIQGNVIYRVLAVGPKGQIGWNTVHWSPPCKGALNIVPTVTGSSVRLDWQFNESCTSGSLLAVPVPNIFRVTSSFGYAGDFVGARTGSVVVDGLPRGTHSFTFTGIWYPDAKMSTTVNVVIQL